MALRCFIAVAFALSSGGPARAHSWYDSRCCSEYDCHRALKVEHQSNGDRIVTADNGIVVLVQAGFGTILPSQDSDYHICYYFTWQGVATPRCLYVPGSS